MSKCEMCIHKCVCRFQESDNECVYFRKESHYRQTKIKDDTIEKILLAYKECQNWSIVAKKVGISYEAARRTERRLKNAKPGTRMHSLFLQYKSIINAPKNRRETYRSKFTTEILEKAIALRNQNNMTWDDIGKELDVNGHSLSTTIYRVRKQKEIKIISRSGPPRTVFTNEILEKAIALHDQNKMTWNEIGNELDVNGNSLQRTLCRLRKRGELK